MKRIMRSLIAAMLLICFTGCSAKQVNEVSGMVPEYFGEKKNAFGNVEAPASFDWKQCDGVVLNLVMENNINAQILSKECDKFTEVTGIKVNIKSMDFDTLMEKINIEFIADSAQYELIYTDPYQTLNRFHENLEDLYYYENDPDIPHIVGGLESFPKENLEVCSYFEDTEKLCAIPFDSTTMILFYRKDIFDKYRSEMMEDLGYDPVPGSTTFTWERYIEVSRWISSHVPKSEIKYGSISASARHNSIYAEFSSILSAYGGNYFYEDGVSSLGITAGGELHSETDAFAKALKIYKEIVHLNAETVGSLNWSEASEAFMNGEAAMMMNWDENAAAVENSDDSAVAGKVGYGVLPYGSVRSANIYGGSGLGMNAKASEEKKLAAWLFIVWATSPQIQMVTFLEENGGNMPTRSNLNHLISGQYLTILPHALASIRAQKKTFSYYRPKMEKGYEFETIVVDNLYNLVTEDLDENDIARQMKVQWDEAR